MYAEQLLEDRMITIGLLQMLVVRACDTVDILKLITGSEKGEYIKRIRKDNVRLL